MIEEWSIVFEHGVNQFVHWRLSELRCFLQVVDTLLNAFLRQARSGEGNKKQDKACDEFLSRQEIPFVPHLILRPFRESGAKGQHVPRSFVEFPRFSPITLVLAGFANWALALARHEEAVSRL